MTDQNEFPTIVLSSVVHQFNCIKKNARSQWSTNLDKVLYEIVYIKKKLDVAL